MADTRTLTLDGTIRWHCAGGRLSLDDDDALTPAPETIRSSGEGMQGHHYAFDSERACGSFEATFRFRLTPHSDAGLIFAARSAGEFHVLHFPDCGQASRAQHFWVALSRMRSDGALEIVRMEMLRRVSSTSRGWHQAQVAFRDGRLAALVDGVGAFHAQIGKAAGVGCVGVCLFNNAAVKDLSVSADWQEGDFSEASPAGKWFHVWPSTDLGQWQRPGQIARTKHGDLLLSCSFMERPYGGRDRGVLLRSGDRGMTWSDPVCCEDLGLPEDSGALHRFPDGALRFLYNRDEHLQVFASADDGFTWAEEPPVPLPPLPEGMPKLHVFGVVNSCSRVLLVAYGGHGTSQTDVSISSWGAIHCQSFCSLSEDGGRTWQPWVNFDGTESAEGKPCIGNLDLTETSVAETADGRLLSLTRPVYSPWMWESWSDDGGRTWSPCVRGPFAGYACSNLIRTSSGALLVGHRLPGLTVHCSRDAGRTWDQGTMIDSAIWAMGCMVETAPDTVLYVYYDSFESLMRGVFLRVDADKVAVLGRDEVPA